MQHLSLWGKVEHTKVHLPWGIRGGHLSHGKAQRWEVRDDARLHDYTWDTWGALKGGWKAENAPEFLLIPI